jgi:hypothetical protein
MHAEGVGELLLGHAALLADGADVRPRDSLEITLHGSTISEMILERLHTDE